MSPSTPPGRLARARAALRTSKLSHALAGLLGVILAAGVTIAVEPGPGPHRIVVHIGQGAPKVTTVDSSAKPGVQPVAVKAPAVATRQAAASPELNQHGALRDESPAGVSDQALNQSQRKQEQLAHNDQLPIVQPDAAPSQRGCVSRFVRNYSSRRGVAPREWVLHYTVSHNTPGWGDVDAIVNLFNTASDQASSNYVIDTEGHCAYIVRETDKAWTQAGGNPYSISVEVVDYGNESTYLQQAGLAKVAEVISDSAARWHIPIRRGAVSNCVPTRAGIIQHKDWGLCGGGHFDITPFSVDTVIRAVQAFRRAHSTKPCSKRTACRMGRRHAAVHKAINSKCHGKQARTHAPACRKLRARNDYLHRYASQHHLTLVTR